MGSSAEESIWTRLEQVLGGGGSRKGLARLSETIVALSFFKQERNGGLRIERFAREFDCFFPMINSSSKLSKLVVGFGKVGMKLDLGRAIGFEGQKTLPLIDRRSVRPIGVGGQS